MEDANISDAGLESLGNLTNLETIALVYAGVSDSRLEKLKHFTMLTELGLDGNPLTDASVPLLGMLTNLKRLSLFQTKITADGITKLESCLPDCKIQHASKLPAPPVTAAPATR